MRILIDLKSLKGSAYDLMYNNKLQGFLYNMIKDSPYSFLHNKKGYKFFSFSNIFPPTDCKEGDIRHLMISSPDNSFLQTVSDKMEKLYNERARINIGDCSFSIESLSFVRTRMQKSFSLITGTPIVIRIPKQNYQKYSIQSDYPYVFWKPEHSFEAFLKQLVENVYKKYNGFHKADLEAEPLFQQFVFKKPVVNHVVKNGKEIKIFGSVWEFPFSYLSREQQNVLGFGIDCGFGELNSLGFGFMNVKK